MLDYFAGRRFNQVDLIYNAFGAALIWQGLWWWALATFVGGIALSVSLEFFNGEFE